MLSVVEVRTDQGALLQLPMADISGGYAVQEIRGLEPVKATLVTSSFAQLDGGQFHSSRRESRNIVITLGYEPDYISTSVQSLRKNLYDFFLPEARVSMRFIDDGSAPTVNITGRVESFDAPLYTDDPTATISIMCLNPDFYAQDEVQIDGFTVPDSTNTNITYDGEVESGIQLEIFPNRALSEFTVYSLGSDNVLRSMIVTDNLSAGDKFFIDTTPGAKRVTHTVGGITSSSLYTMSPYSTWVYLLRGLNQFRVYAEGAPVPYTLKYTAKYGGL